MSRSEVTRRRAWTPPPFFLSGDLPGLSDSDTTLFRVRLFEMLSDLVRTKGVGPFAITTGYGVDAPTASRGREETGDRKDPAAHDFVPVAPVYGFDRLVLPRATREALLDAVAIVEVGPLVFGTWNLRSVEPRPSTALSFQGPPGTGKTMAAHAVAQHLGRNLLSARLSDLESKYHGDGPKNIVRLFDSATRSGSVLFIDEAESVLSRRYAQPDQAAESSINSMRTELFMALDAFEGLAIFASNLEDSYDTAVLSRLHRIDFDLPDYDARLAIWRSHWPAELPREADVTFEELAEHDGLTGRDIKSVVITAAVGTARRRLPAIPRNLLLEQIASRRPAPDRTEATPVAPEVRDAVVAHVATRENGAPVTTLPAE